MDKIFTTTATGARWSGAASLFSALARASAAIARLDQALTAHPLSPAFLHRSRLDAVRRQAAADGRLIDPWHLAALIEGLRLRMDPMLSIAERGEILEAGRHAFGLHQWLTMPDFDQEREIQCAEKALAAASPGATPLLAAARGMHAWLGAGGDRAPIRTALTRFWMSQKMSRTPVPLTGAASLGADAPWDVSAWEVAFLDAIAAEAGDGLQLLFEMERAWFAARTAVAVIVVIRVHRWRWTSWPRHRLSRPVRWRLASRWRSRTPPRCWTSSAPWGSRSR